MLFRWEASTLRRREGNTNDRDRHGVGFALTTHVVLDSKVWHLEFTRLVLPFADHVSFGAPTLRRQLISDVMKLVEGTVMTTDGESGRRVVSDANPVVRPFPQYSREPRKVKPRLREGVVSQ